MQLDGRRAAGDGERVVRAEDRARLCSDALEKDGVAGREIINQVLGTSPAPMVSVAAAP